MITSRELALKILYDIDENKAYSNIELRKKLDNSDLPQVEKSFTTELVYGVLKWRLNIDWIIGQMSSLKIHKISPWIINILRIGIYQMKFLHKVPVSAAVNESVKLAKKYGNAGSIKFVNGLLRNYSRKADTIKYPDESDMVKYISVVYSHPEWLVKHWIEKFGADFTKTLCDANNSVPQLSARVNTLKSTKEKLKSLLNSEGVESNDGHYFENSIIFNSGGSISNFKAFKEGLFQVQDESSMLVGAVADPKPGQTVADVCAAPGGKSTHLAELMKNEGTLYSRDIHEHKIKLIEDSAARLGINIIKTSVHDASELDETLVDKCDIVLVDAPCSGLGIIRRKPDIKWNRQVEDNTSLTEIQRKILEISSKYVKKGGTLVYSTCTIEDDENLGVVKEFLKSNNNFSLTDISKNIPDKLLKDSCKEGYIQVYPNVDAIDGFFICKMRREG